MLDIVYDPPERESNTGKPFKWIIIDSLIIGVIAFLAALPANRIPTLDELYVALRAFAYSFVLQLAVERGLKPQIAASKARSKKVKKA